MGHASLLTVGLRATAREACVGVSDSTSTSEIREMDRPWLRPRLAVSAIYGEGSTDMFNIRGA